MKKNTILAASLTRILGPLLLLMMSVSTVRAGNDPGDDATAVVKQKLDYVKDKGLLVSQLSPSDVMTLPVGVVREIDGKSFIIAIDSARVKEDGGSFSAFAGVKLPGTDDDDFLAFAARNIRFKATGGIDFSNAKLMLVSERIINISEKIKLRLPADGHNYIEWDCNGFKTISLKGEFIFDPTLITPDLEMNPNATKVTATFEVVAQAGFNFLISTSITPFRIKGLGDMSFSVQNATLDLSDLINPTNFVYPLDYPSYYGGNGNLWRGFYLEELKVKLPKGISTSNGRAQFTAHNVVIDEMGFSGFLGVTNLFDISSGSIDGWAFSVDSIGVQILQNRLVGGGLKGKMNVPFLKDDELLYNAEMVQRNGNLDFSFAIQTSNAISYNMAWGGTLKLNAGSQVKVEKFNGRYAASAILHGSLTVSQPVMNADQINFQNLELSTRAPYLIRGTFALASSTPSQSRYANFPISLSNFSFGFDNGSAYLQTMVKVNLMNASDNPFNASAGIRVKAKMQETIQTINGEEFKKHKWVFEGIGISRIALSAKIGTFEMDGSLTLFDDANESNVYGKGFQGSIKVKFPPLRDYIRANVYFGSKNDPTAGDFRYWQVNLYVPISNLVIVPPLVNLTGILGGASYHMKRIANAPPVSNSTFAALNTTGSGIMPTSDSTGLSNRIATQEWKFIPDVTSGLGIELGVTLALKEEKVATADATLGVIFNTNGGINQIYFKGGVYFFAGLNRERKHFNTAGEAVAAGLGPVVCFIDMLYDNPNKVFHASIRTYINIANIIKGINDNNGYVGEAVVHADPNAWYIYIGRPSQMMGLELFNVVSIRSYFMMGNRIERMPNPPPQVSDILGGNWTAPVFEGPGGPMDLGQGFGFGAHFAAHFPKTGEFRMGPFYAGFHVGAGADIMITKYNGQVNCNGNIITPGIKGWYAAGQVYAYLQGSIGIKIRKKKFSIIDVGAAAILQARLPNPTYMKGAVGGRFRLLGGLIKGSVRFSFTIGTACTPVNAGSEIDNIKVIESMKPDSASTYQSVFINPVALFSVPIDAEMPLVEDDGTVHTYRVRLIESSLTDLGDTPGPVPGTWRPNSNNDGGYFETISNLDGQTWHKFKVVLKWEEKKSNGWQPVLLSNGQPDTETREVTFRTDNAPESVPEENVKFSYPITRQYNMYKNQSAEGYVQLKKGQPAVFSTTNQYGQWEFKAQFSGSDGSYFEVPVNYNSSNYRATFSIPNNLTKDKIYEMKIMKLPVGQVSGSGVQDSMLVQSENVYVSETNSVLNEMNDGFAMTDQYEQNQVNSANTGPIRYDTMNWQNTLVNRVANTLNITNELVLFRVNFRVSNFNTFADKVNALNSPQEVLNVVSGNTTAIGKRYTTTESFDEIELFGKGLDDIPLVQLTSDANVSWLTQKQNYLMYDLYGQFNSSNGAVDITWRNLWDLRDYGAHPYAPLKGVKLHNNMYPNGYALTDDLISNGYAPPKDDDVMFAYYLSYYCARDFYELRNKAALYYLYDGATTTGMPDGAERLIFEPGYSDLFPGKYTIKAYYCLPGYGPTGAGNSIDLYFQQAPPPSNPGGGGNPPGGGGNPPGGSVVMNDQFIDPSLDGWDIYSDIGGLQSVSNLTGSLRFFQNGSARAGVYKAFSTVPGQTYKFAVDIDKGNCSGLKVYAENASGTLASQVVTANGRVEITFVAGNTPTTLRVEREAFTVCKFFNIDNATLTVQ